MPSAAGNGTGSSAEVKNAVAAMTQRGAVHRRFERRCERSRRADAALAVQDRRTATAQKESAETRISVSRPACMRWLGNAACKLAGRALRTRRTRSRDAYT